MKLNDTKKKENYEIFGRKKIENGKKKNVNKVENGLIKKSIHNLRKTKRKHHVRHYMISFIHV